jgi:hypothetical protein
MRAQRLGGCRPGGARAGGCCQVNAAGAICQPEGARSGELCHVERKQARSTLLQSDRRPCVRRGVNPKRLVIRVSIRTELPNSGLQLTRAPERLY